VLEELARRLAEVIGYVGSVEDGVAGFGDHVLQGVAGLVEQSYYFSVVQESRSVCRRLVEVAE